MTSDLDRAVEQFHAALDEHDEETCNMRSNGVVDGYDKDIVKALLAAGWRPPEVTGPEHFDREYARKVTQYRAAFNEVTEKMTSDALEWKDQEPPTSPPAARR